MRKIKLLFEKNFVSAFEEKGYHYSYEGANNFKFESNDGLISARFDVPILIPNCMRVRLFQFYRYGWESFILRDFNLESFTENEIFFNSEGEFIQNVGVLVVDTLRSLLLLEHNKSMLVTPNDSHYTELSIQPSKKSHEFAQQNHLEYLPLQRLSLWAIQWLQDCFLKQAAFLSSEETLLQLIPFCAYCGEIYCRDKNGQWMWLQDIEDVKKRNYVVLWGDYGIDILGQAAKYLSYHSIMREYKLFPAEDEEVIHLDRETVFCPDT